MILLKKISFTQFIGFIFLATALMSCIEDDLEISELPSVAITAPAASSPVLDTTTIVVDASDERGIARVEISIDGKIPPQGTLLYEPYILFWNTSGYSDSSVHIIQATAYDIDSNFSVSKSLSIVIHRFAPTDLQAKIHGDTNIVLSWKDNCTVETGYEIYQAYNDSDYQTVRALPANTTTVGIEGIYKSTDRIYFSVRALLGTQRSKYSNVQWVQSMMPRPIIQKQQTMLSDSSISLRWVRDPNSYETSFEIEKKIDNYPYLKVAAVAMREESVTLADSFLVGHTYIFRMRGAGRYNVSQYSDTMKIVPTFNRPSITEITSMSRSAVQIKWTYTHHYETRFLIERKRGDENFAEIGSAPLISRAFNDPSVDTMFAYTYRLRADSKYNKSTYSNTRSVSWQSNYFSHASLPGNTAAVNAVIFSRDGNSVISAGSDNSIRFWKISDSSSIRVISGAHSGGVQSLAISADGQQWASGGGNGVIKIWRFSDASLIHTISSDTAFVSSLAFSPDGTQLAAGRRNGTVTIYRTSDISILQTVNRHSKLVSSIAFTPSGSILATGSYDSTVCLWNTSGWSLIRSINEMNVPISAIAVYSNGQSMMVGGAGKAGGLQSFSIPSGSMMTPWFGYGDVRSVAITEDNQKVVAGFNDGKCMIWIIEGSVYFRSLQVHPLAVTGIAVSGNDEVIATASIDGSAHLWKRISSWLDEVIY